MSATVIPAPHYRLAPSAAKQWAKCTALIDYIEANRAFLPPDETVYSTEGTEAHEWARKVNMEEIFISDVPDQFRDHVAVFTNKCGEVRTIGFSVMPTVLIEQRVQLFYAPVSSGENCGTIDFAAFGKNKLAIIDLKYGSGVYVDEKENLQLAIYAMSLVRDCEGIGQVFPDDMEIELTIVQPRYAGAAPVRTWRLTLDELRTFCLTISTAVLNISLKKTEFYPSADTCQFCLARKLPCEARARHSFKALPGKSTATALAKLPDLSKALPAVTAITTDQLVHIKRYSEMLRTFLKDVDDILDDRASRGDIPPGMKLVQGRQGNRQWKDEKEAERYLEVALGSDAYTINVISPAAAKEKLAKKGKPITPTFEDEFITRSPGKPVLVFEDDKRPAIKSISESALDKLP